MEIFYNQVLPVLEKMGFELVNLHDDKMAREHLRRALPKDVPIKEKPFKEGYIDHFKIIEPIGSGAYGTVFKVKDNDKLYAIKQINFSNGIHWWDAEGDIKNEIELLRKASEIKPRITAKFREAFISHDLQNLYIVIDYINCGTLEDWTKEHELNSKNIADLKTLVKTLHEHKIYHRDLHLENIMVQCDKDGTPTFLLSDFGLSKMLKQLEESNYDWIRNLGKSNNAIRRQIRHIRPDMMIKELILYDMLINNHIRLI